MRKTGFVNLIQLLLVFQFHLGYCHTDFDFFYFSQQWPGSECNTKLGCCYPTSGKPKSDFIINKFQPIQFGHRNPVHCTDDPFNKFKILHLMRELIEHWPVLLCPTKSITMNCAYNWKKFGTCSNFEQEVYIQMTLNLKNRLNLLDILISEGIRPNGKSYNYESIRRVIIKAVGLTPIIYCNEDTYGYTQLHEIHFCVEKSGLNLTRCPEHKIKMSRKKCGETINFPTF